MIRQNAVPLAVLAALLIAGQVVPRFWFPPDPMMLEHDSDRIGWGAASEGADAALDIYERRGTRVAAPTWAGVSRVG